MKKKHSCEYRFLRIREHVKNLKCVLFDILIDINVNFNHSNVLKIRLAKIRIICT